MMSGYGLGTHYDDFVRSLVESGRYASPGEVVRDGLRLMEQRERLRESKLAALRADIAEGLESGFDDHLSMDDIKQTARQQRDEQRRDALRDA